MHEFWAFEHYLLLWLHVTVATCVLNRLLEVDEYAGLFHSSSANKIILVEVNFVYIGPHSRGPLQWFLPNCFCPQNAPQSAACTMVSIPLPPFTSNYRATSCSGSINDRRSMLPLFPSHRIKRHVPNSTEHPRLIKRAGSQGVVHKDHRFLQARSPTVDFHVLSNTPYILIFLASFIKRAHYKPPISISSFCTIRSLW